MLSQEEHETPNGWPLGLENINVKLRSPDHIETTERNSIHVPSSSFSSFSSSNLDTESSASTFQDHSVSLGRLIGIRHGEAGWRLYFPNANHVPTDDQRLLHSEVPTRENDEMEMSCGICVPKLCNIIVMKMSRSKSSSAQ